METPSNITMIHDAVDPAELKMIMEITKVEQEVAKCRSQELQNA